MLHELGQIGNTHGLSFEEELNALTTLKDSNFFLKPKLFTTPKKANKRKRTAEMVKDAMYRTAAVEMFHRGADLVRKETPRSSLKSKILMESLKGILG
jgi:hypothetical protein